MVRANIQFTTVIRDHVEAVHVRFFDVEEELGSDIVGFVLARSGNTED